MPAFGSYPYDTIDIVGSFDCMRPGRVVSDLGLETIIAACDDDSQIVRMASTMSTLYPSLRLGPVCIPTLSN